MQVSATTVKDLGSHFRIIRGKISICKNERFAITPITDVSAACGSWDESSDWWWFVQTVLVQSPCIQMCA